MDQINSNNPQITAVMKLQAILCYNTNGYMADLTGFRAIRE